MTTQQKAFLPYGRQSIDERDIAAVVDVLRGDWLTTGPMVDAFEADFAVASGAAYAISCSSGTAALHMAALALDFQPGHYAVVPAVTFSATANALRYCGSDVIIADVDPATGLLTTDTAMAAIHRAVSDGIDPSRIRAFFPVHLNGQCVEILELTELAAQTNCSLVFDACHAIGSDWYDLDGNSHKVGANLGGAMSAFSLHPVKTVTMGEGGVVTTDDADCAERLRRLRSHGITRDPACFVEKSQAFDSDGEANPWYQELVELGYNYRASDVHCALGRSQLTRLDAFVSRRRELAARYDSLLTSYGNFLTPVARTASCNPAWHLYAVLIDFALIEKDRATVMRQLAAEGIGTQVHYLPLHRQPYYRQRYGQTELPGADAYYERCLSLPLYPTMEVDDVDRVVDAIAGVLSK